MTRNLNEVKEEEKKMCGARKAEIMFCDLAIVYLGRGQCGEKL